MTATEISDLFGRDVKTNGLAYDPVNVQFWSTTNTGAYASPSYGHDLYKYNYNGSGAVKVIDNLQCIYSINTVG